MTRRRAAIGVALLALAVTVGLAGCGGGPDRGASPSSVTSAAPATSPSSSVGPEATGDPWAVREAALADLLARRARAVAGHDRAAYAATLDDPASAYGRRQLAAFDAMALLPLADFGYGAVRSAPALSPARAAALGRGAWVASVQGHYELAGYDRGARSFDTSFTVVRRAGGWRLADDADDADDGDVQAQPWDLPGMRVVRTPTTLVVGNVPEATLRSYLVLVDRAMPVVDGVWTRTWPHRVVVVAPATVAQMQAQLSARERSVTQVAAVTDGPAPQDAVAATDRIVVNPQAFAALRPDGRKVVLTHETTHVAVRSSLVGRVPLWLSEGLADVAGYRTVDLSDGAVVQALTSRVRQSGLPAALPADTAFDAATTTIAPAYNEAWLAVRLLEEEAGPAGLTRFYAAAASTGSDAAVAVATDAAFGTVLRTTRAAFTTRWLATVRSATG